MSVIIAVWWRGPDLDQRPSRAESAPAAEPHGVTADMPNPRPSLPRLAWHTELGERVVELPSDVTVDRIDTDRPWVCAGEPIALSARISGLEPGATLGAAPGVVYRWLWRGPDGVELHPGPAMHWRAPPAAGTYAVRFQVCQDLGGRRIGVLAERAMDIEVRACATTESQHDEPLRLRVVQRGHGAFAFHAEHHGEASVEAYDWDLGDGATETTIEPVLEHGYATDDLGPHHTRSAMVSVQARLANGQLASARAMIMMRGQPAARDRDSGDQPAPTPTPTIELDIARWQPRPDGQGWDSELTVQSPDSDITWDRLERTTRTFDGREDVATRDVTEVIRIDEHLGRGGFRGVVEVDASEVPAEVKQIIDALYGHDAMGNEVVISWSPFKRATPDRGPIQPTGK